ncbi:hypothetical protein [Paenibacillus sp. S25]|uniref:hypothetical protein n=1 Tax=Paenibacillus sp. S25 TaxID=2823905 RepID=UPI001C6492B5|nr:hypothetical protein [Paenibacillus sp. S25]QYK61822.1 hypothetical protein KAI37_02146 [Paenibacillus sp. S25]
MDGWIKLHRKITESAIFSDPDLLRLWIYCLAKAAYKEKTVMIEKQEINLQPGQFVTGRFALHDEYNRGVAPRKKIKETTLWSWLKRLETFGNLDIKSFNKYSVVSIVKWSEYQETLTTEPQQTDNRLTTEPQQTDTNKKLKNLENIEKGENISTTTTDESEKLPLGDIYTKVCGTFFMPENFRQFFKEVRQKGYNESFCKELLLEASESADNGKVSINFLKSISERWMKEGIHSRQQSREMRGRGNQYAEHKVRGERFQSGGHQKESEFAYLDRQNRTGTQG